MPIRFSQTTISSCAYPVTAAIGAVLFPLISCFDYIQHQHQSANTLCMFLTNKESIFSNSRASHYKLFRECLLEGFYI